MADRIVKPNPAHDAIPEPIRKFLMFKGDYHHVRLENAVEMIYFLAGEDNAPRRDIPSGVLHFLADAMRDIAADFDAEMEKAQDALPMRWPKGTRLIIVDGKTVALAPDADEG